MLWKNVFNEKGTNRQTGDKYMCNVYGNCIFREKYLVIMLK